MGPRWLSWRLEAKSLLQGDKTATGFVHLSYRFIVIADHTSQMALDSLPPIPRSGRLQAILSSSGAPTRIVVPDTPTSHELSIAQRLAHDLYMYFGISPVNVVTSSELLQGEAAGPGNLIVVGSSERNEYATDLLGRGTTPLKVEESGLVLEGRKLSSDEGTSPSHLQRTSLYADSYCPTGAIFLHPHPDDQASVALFILGSNEAGLERALRLFPIRTALPGPDFVVIGPEADELGAGGVRAAGYVFLYVRVRRRTLISSGL